MRTVSAGGGHGPILLGKSEAGGGSIASTKRPTSSYVNLQGVFFSSSRDFLHRACKKSPILVKKCN
jgi:hypothetical protein